MTNVSPIPPEVFKAFQQRIHFRNEIEREMDEVQSRIRQKREETFLAFRKTVAEQAGIGMDKLLADGRLRHRAQRRLVEQARKRVGAKVEAFVKEEAARRRATEQRFCQSAFKDSLKKEGNPALLVWEPHLDVTAEVVTRDAPGGMVGSGCHDPVFASHEYESRIVLDHDYDWPNQMLYCRNSVGTGDDDTDVWQRLEQAILLTRPPLLSGWGDFNIESLQVWLRGTGFCLLDKGHLPLFGSGALDPVGAEARVALTIHLMQQDASAPMGFSMAELLRTESIWHESGDFVGVAYVEPYIGPAAPVTILNPDHGGGHISVYFCLETFVGAYHEDAHASLNFLTDGLHLHDLRLVGHFAR